MNRRSFMRRTAAAGAVFWEAAHADAREGRPLPAATWDRLPRWRGFNLLEKFHRDNRDSNRAYQEWDFDTIADWGFDFVRLPMDYRIWTDAPDTYREAPLKDIDQAVAWGRARGIHVSLNLHRGPGYTVASPKETLDLWSDGPDGVEARRQFAGQWRMFAARYRGIPSAELSFNLLNEPAEVAPPKYERAARAAVEAIRSEDPDRLILADGRGWGREPAEELIPLKVAQCTRGYDPMAVTHYGASWVNGGQWPLPSAWPIPAAPAGILYGDWKKEWQSPLVLRGALPSPAECAIHVRQVCAMAVLVMRADGREVYRHELKPGPGAGEWKTSEHVAQYNTWKADYDREFAAALPAGTREIAIALDQGDWAEFSRVTVRPAGGGRAVTLVSAPSWGRKQEPFEITESGTARTIPPRFEASRETLRKERVEPWVALARRGVGVMVGEWGVFNRTPHEVTLSFMRDCLANWKEAGFGWALWNLRGSFGVLDSQRADVAYEDHRGRRLDRRMLELLRNG